MACSSTNGDNVAALEETTRVWVLESYGEKGMLQPVLAGTEVTAEFDGAEKRIEGSTGCNHYFGSYEADEGYLSIGQLAQTERACLEPEGAMDQEHAFVTALQAAESFEIKDSKLYITGGSKELVFISRPID
jgi:heat shock protein HslJ